MTHDFYKKNGCQDQELACYALGQASSPESDEVCHKADNYCVSPHHRYCAILNLTIRNDRSIRSSFLQWAIVMTMISVLSLTIRSHLNLMSRSFITSQSRSRSVLWPDIENALTLRMNCSNWLVMLACAFLLVVHFTLYTGRKDLTSSTSGTC